MAGFFGFFIFLVIPLLMPIVTIAMGLWLSLRRSERGARLAYRSKRSLSSEEAWRFAQRTAGSFWLVGGMAILLASLSLIYININSVPQYGLPDLSSLLMIYLLVIVYLASFSILPMVIPYTERKLKRKFPNAEKMELNGR